MLNINQMSFGMELEYGDIWRNRDLPEGLSWNSKDYSIVSSTGIANDPKGKDYCRGGEINSEPTFSVDGQLDLFQNLLSANLSPCLNHRTNLHLHIRVPGLSQDIDSLKTLLRYVDKNQEEIYKNIEPVPKPQRSLYSSESSYKGALKRYKRRLVSHQYKVPAARVEEALRASSCAEFFDAHSRKTAMGGRAYGLTTRAGINLLQLKETDTVEFRHFTNTLDVELLNSCFTWVKNFVPAALDNASVEELLSAHSYKFPPFQEYNHNMEIGYKYTNFEKFPRKVVSSRLNSLREFVDIDSCSADQVVESIGKIDPEFVSSVL